MAKEETEANEIHPPWLHLLSAFLAMEPPHVLISFSRVCGGGSISETVQRFIWDQCIKGADGKSYSLYVRTFLKKLIVEIESTGVDVIDELYEQFAFYMTSLKGGDDLAKANSRVIKQLSFLYPDEYLEALSCHSSRKIVIPLQCSLNMLEGDTGCSIWPSSMFLSEFILSCPELFSMKSCFEIGSGVGLVGICLAHVKPSKIVLSDGDLSSLANLRLNLDLNHVSNRFVLTESVPQDLHMVKCIHLPWESAPESMLRDLIPDIVLAADVIYDPQCIPHLVRVLAALLTSKKSDFPGQIDKYQGSVLDSEIPGKMLTKSSNASNPSDEERLPASISPKEKECRPASVASPVAYIASVVRNIDTFNYFLMLAEKANLRVVEITQKIKLFDFLPYMLTYQRSSVRLLAVSHLC